MITVAELIRKLEQMPADYGVFICLDEVPYVEIVEVLHSEGDGMVVLLRADPDSEAQAAMYGGT